MTDKTITIIGVGALGSHVAQFLRNEGKLRVVDFDQVEAKNTLAQFHSKASIRQRKATALSSMMNFLWGVKVDANTNKLVENNAEQLIGTPSLVIDCLDNGAARRHVQRYTRQENLPCLHGALAAGGAFGRVIWSENFAVDDEDAAGAPTCEDGGHLPFIVTVASLVAASAQHFLATGKKRGWTIAPTRIEMV